MAASLLSKLNNIPSSLLYISNLVVQKSAEFIYRTYTIDNKNILLIDVKLPRRDEDKLYNNNTIRYYIPRGLCYVFFNNNYVYSLYGHPKFGNFNDFLSKPINELNIKKRIFRRKENGECTHFGAFVYEGQIYIMFGSKNVHLLVRAEYFDQDLNLYSKELRYIYATKMAKLLYSKLKNSHAIGYLCKTLYTFSAEACFTDSQHLVDYKDSDVYFFAITGPRESADSSLVMVEPLEADKLFRSFGLSTVTESIICDDTTLAKTEEYFENQPNSEGAVVSCVDANGKVVYVYKHKNFSYVFFRALREQMRRFSSTSRILKRFNALHITHPDLVNVTDIALKFNAYYRTKFNSQEQKAFFSNWVTHLKEFNLLSNGQKEVILKNHKENEKKMNTLNVIMFVAIPGSGKSFIARVIKNLLEASGQKVAWYEQDMFYHTKDAAKNYENAIKNASMDPTIQYLILSKSNHNAQVRSKTDATLDKSGRNIGKTYVVMTANDGDMQATYQICVQRIMDRGYAHNSLFGKSQTELEDIVGKVFVNQYEELNAVEATNDVIDLDINQSKEDLAASCIAQLNYFGIVSMEEVSAQLSSVFNKIAEEDNAMVSRNLVKLKSESSKDNDDEKINDIKKQKVFKKQTRILYDSLIIKSGELLAHLGNIPCAGLEKKKEFHVTLKFYGGIDIKNSKVVEMEDNESHEITVVGYAVDENALALRVLHSDKLSSRFSNEYDHITFALKDGVKAAYSSTLIKNAVDAKTLTPIEPFKLVGYTKRNFV